MPGTNPLPIMPASLFAKSLFGFFACRRDGLRIGNASAEGNADSTNSEDSRSYVFRSAQAATPRLTTFVADSTTRRRFKNQVRGQHVGASAKHWPSAWHDRPR